jgi:2-hydroxy-3-oxopropionate reductase
MREKIGFIGLGNMGRPMATNLVRAGFDLMVGDLNPKAVQALVDAGAKTGTNEQIAAYADVLVTMLPNGPIVQSVLFGSDGAGEVGANSVAASLRKGAVVCDMSSVKPSESKRCARLLATRGVSFVDAPVSGGEKGAIDGRLAIMCGGSEDDFVRLSPMFDVLGASAKLIGPVGSGSVAKLVNQMIVANTTAVVCEAFTFARKAGADPRTVYEAIRGGAAGSAVLDMKLPQMLDRDFTPPSAATSILHKDVANCVDAAHEVDAPVPYTAQAFEILQSMQANGLSDQDFAAMITYFERLANLGE